MMLGCVGDVLLEEIVIEDDELEVCKWCSWDEICQMLVDIYLEGYKILLFIFIVYELIMGWFDGWF